MPNQRGGSGKIEIVGKSVTPYARYKDDDYKNQHRDYYMADIQADIEWYGSVYSQIGITNKFEIFCNEYVRD